MNWGKKVLELNTGFIQIADAFWKSFWHMFQKDGGTTVPLDKYISWRMIRNLSSKDEGQKAQFDL